MKRLVFFLILMLALRADSLDDCIRNFVGSDVYKINQNFIQRIFSSRQDFYKDRALNHKKILETLKNNGLLKLRFDAPREVSITFSSSTSPIFLLRSINGVLASMGYSYFEARKAEYDGRLSTIVFGLMSEHMIDPLIVIEEMNKRGYIFNDVKRVSSQAWQYDVELIDSRLGDAHNIDLGDDVDLKEVSGEYWLQISNVSGVMEISTRAENWRPKIIFFDKNLQIIDILKKSTRVKKLTFNVLKSARFVLVSDMQNPIAIKTGIQVVFKEFGE